MIGMIIGTGLSALAAITYLVAPAKPSESEKETFMGRNYAHRGLHNEKLGIPENSLAAFRAARDNGFGIELDLQLSSDGQVVVFHDNDLKRLCGVDAPVNSLTYDELRELRLSGTDEYIPLFSEVLEVMDGSSQPLVVELKPTYQRAELCGKALELMRSYGGELCVESFDPFAVAWFRRNAPDIVRGQLTMRIARSERRSIKLGPAESFLLSHVITNFLARPHFIAHRLERKALTVRLAEKMGAMSFAWTSRLPGNEDHHDSVIFEGYLPEPSFEKE